MSNSRTGETPGEKEAGTNLNNPAPPPIDAGPGVAVAVLAPFWYPGQDPISGIFNNLLTVVG